MVMMMTCVCVCIHGQAYLIYIVWNCYKYLIATRRVLPSVTRHPSDVGHRRTPSQPLSPIQSVTATVNAATSTAPDTQVLSLPSAVCLYGRTVTLLALDSGRAGLRILIWPSLQSRYDNIWLLAHDNNNRTDIFYA